MNSGRKQLGFTIIETMLFLGVTGLIMSVMLVGASAQLNQRRYQDAATSLMTYIQNQYSLVSNVNNSRSVNDVCSGNQITTGVPVDQGPGTSDNCTIVGRLLRSTNSGGTIITSPVVATVDVGSQAFSQSNSDVQVLHNAKLTVSLTVDKYSPSWGTKIVKPSPDNAQPGTFSILIVRVPTTGVIHTYASTDENTTIDNLVSQANLVDFKLCLDPSGLLGVASQPTGVRLKADAANTNSIQFVSQGDC